MEMLRKDALFHKIKEPMSVSTKKTILVTPIAERMSGTELAQYSNTPIWIQRKR